jgi:hypothetical protein
MVKRSRTKSRKVEGRWEASRSEFDAVKPTNQMCLIHRDIKHFRPPKAKDFPTRGKVSSIMCAKVLSIMRAGDVGLTSLFKPNGHRLWHAPAIDREHNPGGEIKAVRRQTAISGIAPAGSSRALRLDPLSLPVRFDAHDIRADGSVRHIELHRERVILRRAIAGMQMAVNIRVSDFLGVALRGIDDAQMLVLAHRDPSLTIPLCVSADREEIAAAWQMWSDIFALPQLPEDKVCEPAARRRRHSMIRTRRPKFLARRRNGDPLNPANIHQGEREIIARD